MTGIIRHRILVVDDEAHICRLVVETLGRAKYELTTFTEPDRALAYLESNQVDLVLTDLMMGRYTGHDILAAARENHPDAIVILMTAHPTVETAITVLKKGAYDFLVKPFKLDLLKQAVERGLEHQQVRAENLALKGQVEFLKAANAFIGSSDDLNQCLEMILRSCNTEFSAQASAFLELDPKTGDIVRRQQVSDDPEVGAIVLDPARLNQFQGSHRKSLAVRSEPVEIDGRKLNRLTISQPIYIRRELHGVLNVLTISRRERISNGQIGVLSLLASSVASAIANQNLYEDLQQSYLQAIRALTNAIEARDHHTAGHTDRVTKLAARMANKLNWSERRMYYLHVGCMLHDIGKIGVPDAILNKTGKLSDDERGHMMNHPHLGLGIIQEVDILKPSMPYIIAHHERFDGGGYPAGLKGEAIPIEGRLLAVADTFDAVMSDRPYRKGASLEVAVGELVTHSGTQFDPTLVAVFLNMLKEGEVNLAELYGRDEDLSCLENIGLTETAPA